MLHTRSRFAAAAVALVGLGAAVTGVVGVLPGAHATPVVGTYRFSGPDRYGTAELIGDYEAQGATSFAFGAPTHAVLASGDNFPDALSANFLAGAYGSPVFLTSAGGLSQEALTGIQTLGVKSITIVGGPAAVSPTVDIALTADGITVTRVSGPDRDGTAAAVAAAAASSIASYKGQGLTAILANDGTDPGDHYVDALSGGPMAWAGHFPILLTPGASLDAETQTALTSLNIKHVVVLGGSAAISGNVLTQVEALGISVEVLAGADRQQTAIAIAGAEQANLGFGDNQYNLAVGDNFPDALSGGPLAGLQKAPILLTSDPDDLSTDTANFLIANNSLVNELFVYGGTDAISAAVLDQATGEATCASGVPGTTTSTVGATSTTAASTSTTAAAVTTSTTAASTTTTAAAVTTTSTPASTTTVALPACSATTTTAPTTSTTAPSTSTTAAPTSTTAAATTTSTTL
jgi:putative cell wall-binding protein